MGFGHALMGARCCLIAIISRFGSVAPVAQPSKPMRMSGFALSGRDGFTAITTRHGSTRQPSGDARSSWLIGVLCPVTQLGQAAPIEDVHRWCTKAGYHLIVFVP